jgi:ribosomal protein S27E
MPSTCSTAIHAHIIYQQLSPSTYFYKVRHTICGQNYRGSTGGHALVLKGITKKISNFDFRKGATQRWGEYILIF